MPSKPPTSEPDLPSTPTAIRSEPPQYTAPTALVTANSAAQTALHAHYKLLHLLHHRNKNQHRRSVWYRHFSVLRRETKKLCGELDIALGPGFKAWGAGSGRKGAGKHKAGHALSAQNKVQARRKGMEQPLPGNGTKKQYGNGKSEGKAKATARLGSWVDRGVVQRCYIAFTSLMHTPSSAQLALVLLGVLARIAGLTGITAYLRVVADSEGEAEEEEEAGGVARGLERLEAVDVEGILRESATTTSRSVGGNSEDEEEDVGVVVQMDAQHGAAVRSAERTVENEKGAGEELVTPRKKKRRKRGNAIDEIFAGLA